MRSQKKTIATDKASYVERLNRVLDFIVSDLTRPLQLAQLAELADLSPFHFHRIFQAMIGQTPSDFVKRSRLERALYLMSYGKKKSLTAIALETGFSCSSDFTRSFKQQYGIAPSKFDLSAWREEHKKQIEVATVESQFHLKRAKVNNNASYSIVQRTEPSSNAFAVQVRRLPPRSVAYIRVSDPYQGDGVIQAARRLVDWAVQNKCDHGQWLGYQFENPNVTDLSHCYYCVALEVEKEFKPAGEIGLYRFPAMQVAEVEMKGGIELEIQLLQWLYGTWLPNSKYEPDDHPCFESWLGKPFQHGLTHFELQIQLPVKL